MASTDIFSKLSISSEEVFKYLVNSHIILRCASPFFKLENFSCTNSKIDKDTYFVQKCVLSDLLQLFFKVKEIIPNKKIVFEFEGLIKGTQSIYLIENEGECILREKLEFSTYNQFNLPILNFILSIFFYIDSFIKHLRLKNILYKEKGIKVPLKSYSTIRSYIIIDADIKAISSLFEDLNKLAVWISPFLKIDVSEKNKECHEFSTSLLLPFLPSIHCKVNKKESNKIIISFSNSLFKGKNTWSILPCENEFLIENTIELDEALMYLKLAWYLLGNTVIKNELRNWNKRLKEISEKTNLLKLIELPA